MLVDVIVLSKPKKLVLQKVPMIYVMCRLKKYEPLEHLTRLESVREFDVVSLGNVTLLLSSVRIICKTIFI